MSQIGDYIKKRRIELRMSQDDLAEIMGYKDRSTIAKIESGINDVSQSKAEAFADALDTSVAYLIGLPDLPTNKDEISNRDIMFALTNGEATEEISDEIFDEIKEYALYRARLKKKDEDT
ncbi:MAG: helix-turn-helix domain-containing protein [Oscillospiraceae bacterium]|nr:helix-turn-helix domain-containing protein [Oscillospiraceae bacterium]